MKRLAVTALSVSTLAFSASALAHDFRFRPALSKLPVARRAADQRLVLRHDRRVLRATSWLRAMPTPVARFWFPNAFRVRRFHAAQLRWTRRELRESEQMLAAAKNTSSGFSGSGWRHGLATWYGPGFYGRGPACAGNGVLTKGSMWVAAHSELACGTRLTICDRGCVRSWVADRGGFPASTTFDLAPGAAAAIGGHYTHTSIRWRVG